MLTWPIIRKGLAYIFSGKLYIKDGHLPTANHLIPADFIGVCVASAADAAMDDYVIEQHPQSLQQNHDRPCSYHQPKGPQDRVPR